MLSNVAEQSEIALECKRRSENALEPSFVARSYFRESEVNCT